MKTLVMAAALVALVTLGAATPPAASAGSTIEDRLKAEFIERFTRFIEWPGDDARADAREAFVIGVYGESTIREALDEVIRRQSIRDRSARLVAIDDPEESADCDLLFIAGSESETLREVLARTADRPVLTIGDTAGFARRGVLINFFREGEFIRFEINPEAVKRSGLRFSSRLLRLARPVGTEDGG